MISPQDAQQKMLHFARPLSPVKAPLKKALGLVLAEPIVPVDDSPPFDNSAKDGYAVRAADLAQADKSAPCRLKVIETIPAGSAPVKRVTAGTASRIMTGAPMPDGADAVVMVEDTASQDDVVMIYKTAAAGQEIRRKGEDLKRGVSTLERGCLINPARIGLAAAAGRLELTVFPRPKVGILVTGEELVEPGQLLAHGKIRNSNRYALYGQVLEAGAIPVEYGIVRDDRSELEAAIARAINECDIVITSGGVSMGNFDYVIESAQAAGVTIHFTKVAQRPGKPMVGGSSDRALFFGLPGNPVSVMVCFEVFVRPAIRKMLGRKNLFRPTITGIFEEPYTKVRWLHFWTRVLVRKQDDRVLVRPAANQRSDILRSMAFGNGLAEIPADWQSVRVGDPVVVHLLDASLSFS